jgi:hypothetical protein
MPPVNHTDARIRAVLDGYVIVDATMTAPIGAGELRWDTSERGLLTGTAAILDRPEAGQLRGRAVLASGEGGSRSRVQLCPNSAGFAAEASRHVCAVGILAIVAEWLARGESRTRVERAGWRECFH